jgi:hypothetical protein
MRLAPIVSWFRTLAPALCLAFFRILLSLAFPHTPATLAGIVLLMTLLGTTAAIAAGASGPPIRWHAPLGIGATLLMLTATVFSLVAIDAGFRQAASTSVVALSWSALWGILAWALRRQGPGLSVGMPLGLASLGMALPVAAVPLVHWAGHWTSTDGSISPWQSRVVATIAYACPFFPTLRALRPAVRVDWGTLPGMYAWSGLGQEIPLQLPSPWLCALLYAVLAAAIWYIARRTSPRLPNPAPRMAHVQ